MCVSTLEAEIWIESDSEIEEDIALSEAIIPSHLPDELVEESTEIDNTIRWVITLLSIFQTQFYLTNRALSWLLTFLFVILRFLGRYSNEIARLAHKFPSTLHQYQLILSGIIPNSSFEKRAVCSTCDAIYRFEECVKKVGTRRVSALCKRTRFRKQCNQVLMKQIVTKTGTMKFYPFKVYCYVSLVACIQTLVLQRGFVEQCESTRTQFSASGLSDVYDGFIWKEFLTVDEVPFLSEPHNYGLLLNVDWLQPYKHVEYSVGVIYLVILNLPRSIRYKRENIILYGVIPGPCEPSLTINSYLLPLVNELRELWEGVQLKLPTSRNSAKFRCALLGVACDLPAARKCCGFLSFCANLGCSRCFQKFSRGFGNRNNYADFSRDRWELRTNDRHRSDVIKVLKCTSKSEQAKEESRLGCRYSVLLELPYFRPIEMLLIDPMHNLFLGTAKHFARDIWIGRNILDVNALAKIDARLKNSVAPPGLGRLPSSIKSGTFLTADQWKNWTLYYSVYCLSDLLPQSQLDCWRKFVLACRRLVKYSISNDDICVADGLLLKFCQKSVEIYGENAITPNMHMHCHLAACLREFGPIHSFWLFPFERYNGILEGQPSNNRSIEMQLMRRFQNDNLNLQLHQESRTWPNADIFFDALPSPSYDILSPVFFDTSVTPGPKSIISSLSQELVECLSKLYCKLYPTHSQLFEKGEIFVPSTFRKYSALNWHGQTLNVSFRGQKTCYVFLPPPFPFPNDSQSPFEGSQRLAEIEYFMLHTISLPGASEPSQHLLACVLWPMVHPNRHHYGNPVQVWCKEIYEPHTMNKFCLASSISSRAIISYDTLDNECVCVAIPLVE